MSYQSREDIQNIDRSKGKNTGLVSFKNGIVHESKVGWAKVQFPDVDDLLTQWIPVMHSKTQDDKQFWTLDVGEQVKCLMDERLEDGCVVASLYSEVDVPPTDDVDEYGIKFKDGGWFSYNRRTGLFTALIMGDAVIEVGANLSATVTGNATAIVGGNLAATVGGTSMVDSAGNATLKAPKVTLQTAETHLTGLLKVDGAITGGTVTSLGTIAAGSTITSVGTVTAAGVVLS
ncbi:MAG: phage baseplate assembly protein V [Burkholderiaceae bacterium]|nr:phage baseplate assembly protein V [Burkholderiaceae bacterium]